MDTITTPDPAHVAILTGTDQEAARALMDAERTGASPERIDHLTRAYIARLQHWTDATTAQDHLLPAAP
jgi:hypothetical protein